MKPVPVSHRRFEQPPTVMMLDDAEMALSLVDLANTTTLVDTRRSPAAAAKAAEPVRTADANTEIRSAACLVLDPEEAEKLQKELDQALRPEHTVAA